MDEEKSSGGDLLLVSHHDPIIAKEITPLQASFLATILPSPKRRYVHYYRGELSESWDRYVRRVLRRMVSKGYVSEEHAHAKRLAQLSVQRDLARIGMNRVDPLQQTWIGDGQSLAGVVASAPVMRYAWPILELRPLGWPSSACARDERGPRIGATSTRQCIICSARSPRIHITSICLALVTIWSDGCGPAFA